MGSDTQLLLTEAVVALVRQVWLNMSNSL